MSMELSNQDKLSEFYEELKRLNINIIRPDINTCFADFTSNNKDFLYALGAIKNVGYEAISNVVDERTKNGKYKNISDFLNRVNPKNINKLQLEGLVRAGAFDIINNNRQSLFNSIPNIILKSKNNFENKMANQINLFDDEFKTNDNFLEKIDDWSIDTKLSKEFETLGFFISDHPLNQYKIIFNQYNIVSYDFFVNEKNSLGSNIACTVLKIQEKKTQKGNSYAIVKLSDLSGAFELFIFSDVFETNRDKLIEGNSLMVTLIKNYTNQEKTQIKINVKKIVTLKEVLNSNFDELKFKINSVEELTKLKNLDKKGGKTKITFQIYDEDNNYTFVLKDKRNIDNTLINSLKIRENILLD
jgi:DNA polymerase-3 subunit alpha